MQNHLKNQTSPYLLQHADNPVNWYPWCEEAFERAKAEDKPIFLSIGYSTCHWCHVMAHESFEDERIAEILNHHFISVKVDKEERPDIDSIYMSVCQALTGSGGWPTTIFLTPEQKPFYAGTYFPKTSSYGHPGLEELLLAIHQKWITNRKALLHSAEAVISFLNKEAVEGAEDRKHGNRPNGDNASKDKAQGNRENEEKSKRMLDNRLIETAFSIYKRSFDEEYGGFGDAPKFPTPHNLLFLMKYYEKTEDEAALKMVEKTLFQMYRGGIFDHVGGGFSRYSTDPFFLVPHFEKMLYDNALLILAYCKAYQLTKNTIYSDVAEKTADYILREMTSVEGGFFCAQDADSEGVEGKYYLFEPDEVVRVLGEKVGGEFNRYYDITEKGNFEGKNIPNLLKNKTTGESLTFPRMEVISDVNLFEEHLPALYEYRKKRYALHLDDKILTAWNGLMIAAMCHLYRVTGKDIYLNPAVKAEEFIENKLCEENTLYVSYREGKRSGKGFLDDYANEIFALLALYGATLDNAYLVRAQQFCEKTLAEFYDKEHGGFFLYGKENEQLILCPKETYDGAVFSGNSAMAYNLVQLYYLTGEEKYHNMAEKQLCFLSAEAAHYPAGHAMFLVALWDYLDAPDKITIVLNEEKSDANAIPFPCQIPLDMVVHLFKSSTQEYPLKDNKTTFYVCHGRTCQPPVNELGEHFPGL